MATIIIPERFWIKVDVREPGECWPWRAYTNKAGYGVFSRTAAPNTLAHRYMWACGARLDSELMVLHRCDNPPCCNPAHLFQGTATDNARDRSQKGRSNQPRGESHPKTKLTAAQVRQIRALGSSISPQVLGFLFGVTYQNVRHILNGTNWRSVK